MKTQLLVIFNLLVLTLMIVITADAQGNASNEVKGPSEQPVLANEPPTDNEIARLEGPEIAGRTLFEERLSLGVLIFFFLALLLEFLLVFFKKMDSDQGLRIFAITLIIGSSLFLVTAGYNNDQIAPIIGLLGTVAGYLLGNIKSKSDN